MAIFHLSTKPIKRSDGRSATAAAAYRAACVIEDNRTGLKHDYSKKKGVVKTDCFIIVDNKKIGIDRSKLWNLAEKSENRKDGRTAREIIINLPHELNEQERELLVDDFTKSIAEKYGAAIDYAIHLPDAGGDERNHHCHIMMTTRVAKFENDTLTLNDKTNIELSNTKLATLSLPKTQQQIVSLRENWATVTNKHLQKAGIDKRIDHRSFEEQNISAKPTIKLGWQATTLERKGIETEKGDVNRAIKSDNEQIIKLENELYLDKGRLSAQQKVEDMKSEREQNKVIASTPVAPSSIAERREKWKAEQQKNNEKTEIIQTQTQQKRGFKR